MLNISEKNLRIIENYNLFDDLYMNCFFQHFTEGAQFVLRMILDIPDLVVEEVNVQKVTILNVVSKTTRMDVVARDSEGNKYDIEFQVVPKENLRKRGRYYLSNMDLDMLNRGQDYEKLVEAYVIFICEGDATGDEKPIQHFMMRDEDGVPLKDGHHIVFVDANYDGDWKLKDLMNDFKAKDPNKIKYDVLKNRTKFLKEKEEGLMYLNADLQRLSTEQKLAGLQEGRQEEKKDTIRRMLNKNFAIDTIAQIAEVSIDEVEKVKKEMM
ncbi:hypothetical protein EROP_29260 [Erysipelotrichaceae bacterium OPF54]|nr:hypothetical protein EROP_29260 [Erysipelotrichaceae bacterium OPF54]